VFGDRLLGPTFGKMDRSLISQAIEEQPPEK
jgi:hypothetical protein